MFADRGLSPIQISILLMVWALTSFLLEVPSGVLADKYSRKNILFFAEIIRVIGYSFWLFMPNFVGFLIGFILWGIKSAFTSGTFESLVYDELKANGEEAKYVKINGIIQSLGYFAFIFAGLGSSLTIGRGYGFVLVLSIAALLISSLSIFLLPSAKKSESTGETRYFSLLKEGIRHAVRIPEIFKLIIFISLGQALFGALDEYWSIFASGTGLPLQGIGIFFVIYGLVQALASLIAYQFETLNIKVLEFLFFLNGVLLIVAATYYKIPALLLLFVFSFIFKLIDTVSNSRLQHEIINHEVRATVTSVKGFFVELAVIGLYFTFGLMAKYSNYRQAFIYIGIIVSIIGLGYLILNNKESVPAK